MKLPQTFYVTRKRVKNWVKGLSSKRKRLYLLFGATALCFLVILPFLPNGQGGSKQTTTTPVNSVVVLEPQPKVVEQADSKSSNESPKPKLTTKSLSSPIKGKVLRGTSKDAIYWKVYLDYRQHTGVDIQANQGSKVIAAGAGKVSELGTDPSYGKSIVIDHGNGLKTVYCELEQLKVKLNDTVQAGQVLGLVSKPVGGEADLEAHLHYEIRENGKIVN